MGFWSKLAKGLAIGGAGLGTALSFGAAAPALGAALGGIGLGGATGTAVAAGASTLGKVLGAGTGAISQAKASNRGATFEGQSELARLLMERDNSYYNNVLAREQDNRASGTDAFRKLLAAQRVTSPAQAPNVSPYSMPARMPTDAERTGADALTREVMARLEGGPSMPMPEKTPINVDPSLLKAGTGETTLGYLSALLPLLDQLKRQPAPVNL